MMLCTTFRAFDLFEVVIPSVLPELGIALDAFMSHSKIIKGRSYALNANTPLSINPFLLRLSCCA